MKYLQQLKHIILIVPLLVSISCEDGTKKNSTEIVKNSLVTTQAFTNTISEERVFINFSVSGNQLNNTYNITGDQNNSNQNVYNMIYPDGTSGEHKIIELAYMDGEHETSVNMKIPAQKGIIELKEGNKKFNMVMSIGDISLKAQSVSLNLEEIVIDKMMGMTASYLKGSFEGVAIYEYHQNNEEIKEPHLISGSFQFMSPRYKPKKQN